MYAKNYKTLLKKIKERGKTFPVQGLEDNIFKMAIFCELNYKINIIPIKVSTALFTKIDKLTLTFTWKGKGPI